MEARALGGAEAVDALDDLRARVEEDLVDLGDREVLLDGDLDVEALDRERKPRRALLARAARAHRSDAVGRGLCGAIGGGEAAGPVVPGQRGRGRPLASAPFPVTTRRSPAAARAVPSVRTSPAST